MAGAGAAADHVFRIGDAKSELDRLHPGSVQVVVCSPPYFRQRAYGKDASHSNRIGEHVRVTDEELGHEETPEAYVKHLAACFGEGKYLTADGSLWVVIGDSFARQNYASVTKSEAIGVNMLFVAEMRTRGWALWQENIWAKTSVTPSGAAQVRCNPSKEHILWFVRKRVKPRFFPREIREPGTTPAGKRMPPVGGKKYGEYTKPLKSDGMRCCRDVWMFCPARSTLTHVAPFPEGIPNRIIKACTKPGDLVCDPFAGTRTTERAARALGRRSICFDIYDHLAREEQTPGKREREEESPPPPEPEKRPRGADDV
jgi:site-specific DNA-methyltransferase (adenine-specific)